MTNGNASRGKPTGAGAEAAEGIHSADRPRDEEKNTALDNSDRQADGDPSLRSGQAKRRGSEPTTSHSREHRSEYGGGGENGGAGGGKN
jgi:hypothetical protein